MELVGGKHFIKSFILITFSCTGGWWLSYVFYTFAERDSK